MATIRKRGVSQFQARVRIQGHPEATKTFPTRKEAYAWANEQEGLFLQGQAIAHRRAENLNLSAALDRYALEVTGLPPIARTHPLSTL